MYSFGNKAMKTKQEQVDITKYGDDSAPLDTDESLKKNKTALLNIIIEGGKVVGGVYDDTGLLLIPQKLGIFDAKDEDKNKNTQEDNKIKADLENSGLSSDPLSVGISKIIKAKIENNSTPGTSPEEIDDMLIKIMQDIEEEEELFDSTEDDSDNAVEEVDAIIDLISHIGEILETNNKLADQKIIDLRSSLGRAESEKKYLEGIIKEYEDAEKEGRFQTQGITAIKVRLEEAEQKIKDFKTELQKYEEAPVENADEEDIEDQEITDGEEPEEIVEDTKEAPTIKLKIIAGPTFSEADNVCYYRVKAEVTGDPDPEITFSKDDSGGAWGSDTVQINLKDGASYTLKATATNSEDSATVSISLPWGCEILSLGSVTLKGTGVLTGFINKDYYSITMTINLDTGNISGRVSFFGTQIGYITETDPDTGDDTVVSIYCSFRYSRSLSGSMNLESRAITATTSGYVVGTSGGYCENVSDRYFTGILRGTLNGSGTFASGTDSGGEYWSVSR